MAAKGRLGLDIDLDLVPLREAPAPGRDPGLGEPGAHARGRRARAPGRGGGGLPALGPRRHRHRDASPRARTWWRGPAARWWSTCPPACWPTRRRSTRCRAPRRPPREPLDLAAFAEPDDLAGAWRALLGAARTWRASAGSTSATTTWWAPTRSAGPGKLQAAVHELALGEGVAHLHGQALVLVLVQLGRRQHARAADAVAAGAVADQHQRVARPRRGGPQQPVRAPRTPTHIALTRHDSS